MYPALTGSGPLALSADWQRRIEAAFRRDIASLIPRLDSLLRSKKFPVPPRREIEGFLQDFRRILMVKAAQPTPSKRYFPVFSLPNRESRGGLTHLTPYRDQTA
jgi:hypothetical protein